MRTRSIQTQGIEKRMLSIEEASAYISLGLTKSRQLLSDIGAGKHIGRRIVYDKIIIDKYLDSLSSCNIISECEVN